MTTTEIVLRGRVRANKLHAGLLVRKPAPYRGYNICEWTRIARIERERGSLVLYGTDGYAVDAVRIGSIDKAVSWPANSAFEIGQIADDDAEQEARSAAIDTQARGWHEPRGIRRPEEG